MHLDGMRSGAAQIIREYKHALTFLLFLGPLVEVELLQRLSQRRRHLVWQLSLGLF